MGEPVFGHVNEGGSLANLIAANDNAGEIRGTLDSEKTSRRISLFATHMPKAMQATIKTAKKKRRLCDTNNSGGKEALSQSHFPLLMHARETDFDTQQGPRTRFGDGDGSFWDRWLVTTSSGLIQKGEKDYCPLSFPQKGSLSTGSVPPRTGFKRFVVDNALAAPRITQYRERHVQRDTFYHPKKLSNAEKERVQNLMNGYDDSKEEDEENETGSECEPDTVPEQPEGMVKVSVNSKGFPVTPTLDKSLPHSPVSNISGKGPTTWGELHATARRASVYMSGKEEMAVPLSLTKVPSLQLSVDENDPAQKRMRKKYCGELARAEFFRCYKQVQRDRQRFTPLQARNISPYELDGVDLVQTVMDKPNPYPAEEQDPLEPNLLDDTTAMEPEELLETMMSQYTNMITSRTRYLHGCLHKDLLPRASLLLRKRITGSINLAHQGMGDELMLILARPISELPGVTHLDISDNKLTDESLPVVARALSNMPQLTSLHISENTVDSEAAAALDDYLTNHASHLRALGMSRADLDDEECTKFVTAISKFTKVQSLNLSRNLIGTMELRNVLNPDFQTGGESIAEALSHDKCLIRNLDLSWNYIRLGSAIDMGKSLRANMSLTYLNLEYNCFGTEGAEQLGMSLFFNTTLKYLNLAHNNIGSRGAFVLAVALKRNNTLRHLDLSGNPLGARGGKEVLSIATWVKEPLNIKLQGCNYAVHDATCWFDVDHLNGNFEIDLAEPYDRAVLESLLLRYEKDSSINIEEISHVVDGQSQWIELLRTSQPFKDLPVWTLTFDDIRRKYYEHTEGRLYVEACEVINLLAEFDLNPSPTELACMMQSYIRPGSNNLGVEDFIQLFQDVRVTQTEMNYEGSTIVEAVTKKPWTIPVEGTISVKISVRRIAPTVSASSTAQQVANLLRLAATVESKEELIRMSLPLLRLHIGEAMMLYDLLIKDKGDRVSVLQGMLPYVTGPLACRALVGHVLSNRETEKRRLMERLGPAFGPLMGLSTAHYRLDLSKSIDKITAERILSIDNTESIRRRKANLYDTSQRGDFSNIRNARLNDKLTIFTEKTWDESLRNLTTGTLEFDFVSTERPSHVLATEKDEDVLDFCGRVGLIDGQREEERERAWLDLLAGGVYDQHNRTTGRRLASQLAKYYGDALPDADLQVKLEANDALYEQDDSEFALLLRSSARLEGKDYGDKRPSSLARSEVPQGSNDASLGALINSRAIPSGFNTRATLIGTKTVQAKSITADVRAFTTIAASKRRKADDQEMNAKYKGPNVKKFYMLVMSNLRFVRGLNRLLHRARQTLQIERIIYELYMYAAQRVITSKQARFIVKHVPRGRDKKNTPIEKDLRINIAVMLYPKIRDLENFEQIKALFTPEEEAYLICRLGYLNIYNPLKPEGWIELDCSRREERQILKMLMHLNKVEPGKSWIGETYRFDRFQLLSPGWELGSSWFVNEPMKGHVTLRYFSGDGIHLLGCDPNMMMRTALCAVTPIEVTPELRAPYPQLVNVDLRTFLHNSMSEKGFTYNYDDAGNQPLAALTLTERSLF